MFKKYIALVSALIILLTAVSAVPLTASAAEAEQSAAAETLPTAQNPTEIEEATQPEATQSDEEPTEPPQEIDYPQITEIQNVAGGVALKWDNYQNNTIYRVYYRKAAVYNGTWDEKYSGLGWTRLATVRGNSYVHTGLQDAETGIYTIRCLSEQGAFSSGFNAYGWENCYYAAPQISSIHFDETGVHLSWNLSWQAHGVWNGESYRIYRKTKDSGWTRIALTTDSSFTDESAIPGTVYTYTVRMTDEEGSRFLSAHDGGKSIEFDAYPYITKTESVTGGVKLSWLRFAGASNYRIYYRTPQTWVRIGQVGDTTFTDTTVKDGETRIYTIRALNNRNEFISDFRHAGWEHLYHAAPEFVSVTNTLQGVRLTWNRADGAEDYRVYRRTAGTSWRMLTQTDDAEYTDTNVVSGENYSYTLRMISADGRAFMSGVLGGKNITYVAAPVITNVTNTANGAKITWSQSAGAYQYRVYYKNGNTWTRIATTNRTDCVDTTAQNAQTREYTVRCLNANGSFASDFYRDGYVNTFYAPPVIQRVEADCDGGVVLTWKREEGAQDYRVYRKTASTAWTRIGQTAESSFTDTTAVKGVEYFYTLRMITGDSRAFMSDFLSGKRMTVINSPAVVSATNAANGVTLSWKTVKGISSYRVYFRDGDSWTELGSAAATSFTDTSVDDKETRVYAVRCVDGSGRYLSGCDSVYQHTYYAPPALLDVSYADGANTVLWNSDPTFAGYRLYRRFYGEKGWTRIADFVHGDSYYDDGIEAGAVCTYTLRAMDTPGSFITYFKNENPYYRNGEVLNGSYSDEGRFYRFDEGLPASGYYREDNTLYYYRDGLRVEQNQYRKGEYCYDYSRSHWLYELLCCIGSAPSVSESDASAMFALAKSKGILTSYTFSDYYRPVTRAFVAQTMVRALHYPVHSIGEVSDITAVNSDLSTLAFYGYFLPDEHNRLYPEKQVTADEFDSIISELNLYQKMKGKTVIGFGDSIMTGIGNDYNGMTQLIGEKYGMTHKDYSVPGAVVGICEPKSHIADQIRDVIQSGQKADLILMNGGINDTYRLPGIGEFTKGFDLAKSEEKTFTGGFEKAMWLISQQWKNTPVIYIRAHNTQIGTDADERAYGERAIEAAVKWKAAAIDLYSDSDMNAEIKSIAERYTYSDPKKDYPDTVHPNALGYATYYLPPIGENIACAFG